LPEIRREEALRAGKILGIRNHFFLKQKDSHFTQDGSEPFQGVWNRKVIAARLDEILARDSYDYVFVLLPTEETHGHHQAAAFLAIEATNRMPEEKRPAVLGGDPAAAGQPQYRFRPRSEFPMFRTRTETPAYSVNRLEKFGPNNTLSYNVVVNWVIAEHKSQGLFQTDSDKHATEEFWVLETGRTKPGADPEQLFARLNQVVKQ
jgi:LmbE family N-acetylglucosaminyl deacetylase